MVRIVESLVAAAFGIRPAVIQESGRGIAPVAAARQVAIYLSHTRLGLNYSAAGRLFGRDRTTAAHACRVVEEQRENAAFDMILDCLERAVDTWLCRANGPANRA